MHRKPQSRFDPSSPRVRMACAIAAVVATFATAGFIKALANSCGGWTPLIVKHAPIVVAHRSVQDARLRAY